MVLIANYLSTRYKTFNPTCASASVSNEPCYLVSSMILWSFKATSELAVVALVKTQLKKQQKFGINGPTPGLKHSYTGGIQ